jgi:hypothetical protein
LRIEKAKPENELLELHTGCSSVDQEFHINTILLPKQIVSSNMIKELTHTRFLIFIERSGYVCELDIEIDGDQI